MGIKKNLYGIGKDITKGMRKGLSPRGDFDVRKGTKKILGRKPKFGNFKNLGF